jgi:amidase
VVGYKPPFGRNPEEPPFNTEPYNHQGPLARTVADCILMQNVMSGPHPRDIATLKPKLNIPFRFDSIQGWRIAYSLDLGYQPVDPDVQRQTLAALDVFRSLGTTVEEVNLNWPAECLKAAKDHLGYGVMGAYLLQFYHSGQEQMTDYARLFAEYCQRVTTADNCTAEMIASDMYARLSDVFESHHLFICPTIANTGVKAEYDYSQDRCIINGVEVDAKLGWVMTYPFNMLSRCPVLSLPSGRAANDVPTGIQLVGPTYADLTVFQAAVAYEAAQGPFCSVTRQPEL